VCGHRIMSPSGHFPPPSMKLDGDRTCSNSGRQRVRSRAGVLARRNDAHDSLHFAEPLRAEPLCPVTSDVDLLSNCQGVIALDPEVAYRTFNF
jgi:hypothetical protein